MANLTFVFVSAGWLYTTKVIISQVKVLKIFFQRMALITTQLKRTEVSMARKKKHLTPPTETKLVTNDATDLFFL